MIAAAKQRNKHRMHEPHLACLRAQIVPRNDDGLRCTSPILRLFEYDLRCDRSSPVAWVPPLGDKSRLRPNPG